MHIYVLSAVKISQSCKEGREWPAQPAWASQVAREVSQFIQPEQQRAVSGRSARSSGQGKSKFVLAHSNVVESPFMQDSYIHTRQHDRFEVTDSECGRGSDFVRPTADEFLSEYVSNISLSGIHLVTPTPLPIGTSLSLSIRHANDVLLISAVVHWVVPRNETEWSTGCKFDGRIDSEFLDELGNRGAIERRSIDRRAISVGTVVRRGRERDSHTRTAAEIVNYSGGGICVLSWEQFQLGENLLFDLRAQGEDRQTVFAQVQWSRNSQGRHRYGFRFVQPQDFVRF